MVNPEYLRDGSLRLRAADCCFVFSRPRPGILLTTISGYDDGSLGDAPLKAVEAEYDRFLVPLEWFIDASDVSNARSPVFQRWTAWLDTHRGKLKRLAVLTGTRPAHLTISIAQHLSNTETLMTVHSDRASFQDTIGDLAARRFDQSQRRYLEEAVPVSCEATSEGGVRLRTRSAEVSVRPKGAALVSFFAGRDLDVLATPAMDAVASLVRNRQSLTWCADLRGADVSKELMDAWTQWIVARRSSFQRIAILANHGAFALILSIVNFRHGMDELVRIYKEPAEYERAVAAAAV